MAGRREQVVLLVFVLLCLLLVDAGWYMSYTSLVKLNYHDTLVWVLSCFAGLETRAFSIYNLLYTNNFCLFVCLFVTKISAC